MKGTSMSITISLNAVREATKAVVEERPDYDYKSDHDSCQYVDEQGIQQPDGSWSYTSVPSCLVGCVMHRLGVPLGELLHWNDTAADDLLGNLAINEDIEFPDEDQANAIRRYLNVAQTIQDHGGTGHHWSDALRRAEAYLVEQHADVL